MCKLKFVVLKMMIQDNLIKHIDLVEQQDGRYTVKVYGSPHVNFESLETGVFLIGEKSNRFRYYSSIDRATKSLRESGYKGDFKVITYKQQVA